ncbi:MAG TPA: porin [Gemmatimonadales bacterium]|nr:porin [Gemmatimonadales bacterium]
MRSLARRFLAGLPLALVAGVGVARAQTTYPNVKVTGRLQEQFYYFGNEDYATTVGPKSNVFTRRARIEARGNISENVSVYIQPSFEGGRNLSGVATTCTASAVPAGGGTPTITCRTTGRSGLRLRDAYIDVRFTKEGSKGTFYLRGGQEKRPYSRYELTSSNNLPSIERGGGQGLLPRASNDLFGGAGFLSHDVGASLRYEYKLNDLQLVTIKLGAYNGQGESLNDVNDKKSFGARATAAVTPKIDVGASWFAHDGITTVGGVADSSFTNYAWGFDAQYGKPGDEGLFVLGEYLKGTDATSSKNRIQGIQGLAAYNYRLTSPTSWLYAIEPAFRIDVSDPNTDVDDNGSTLVTAGLGFYMSSKAQFRVAYERQSFQGADVPSISGVRSALTVNF